jgi:hypothetical protein
MLMSDYAYEIKEILIYAGDEELTGERFAFRLATGSLSESSTEIITGRARIVFADGEKLEVWLEGSELAELAESFRERVLREGPTSVSTDIKLLLRQLVDESVLATLS